MNGGKRWRDRIVGFERVPPDQLLANPNNYRIHTRAQRDALGRVLDAVGWVGPVIVNVRTGYMIDGHLRVSHALSEGHNEVPVIYVDVSPEEEALVLATFDPLGAMSGVDNEMLSDLIGDLPEELAGAADFLFVPATKGSGWLAGIIAHDRDADGDGGGGGANVSLPTKQNREALDEHEAAARSAQEEFGVQPGDVWAIPSKTVPGEHYVVCGDCTHEAVVSFVRNVAGNGVVVTDPRDEDAPDTVAVITDPPYGVGVEYNSFSDDANETRALVRRFVEAYSWVDVMAITPGTPRLWDYPRPSWLLAWVHPAPTSSGPWGFNGLNPILVYGRDPYLRHGMGRRPDVLVLATDRKGEVGHPTIKPLPVWEWIIERVAPFPGERIIDPFAGSGTTLVAAERKERLAVCVELSPLYAATILRRARDLGLAPERVSTVAGCA